MCREFVFIVLLISPVLANQHLLSEFKPRRHRQADEAGPLRFEPDLYNRNIEYLSSAKIHCRVAGGISPQVDWFYDQNDTLPVGMASLNGTLVISQAQLNHSGPYTCRATENQNELNGRIVINVVVSPRIIHPVQNEQYHVMENGTIWMPCVVEGVPKPTTHWDKNLTILGPGMPGVDIEDSPYASEAKLLLLNNGTLLIRNATVNDSDRYACTAGSQAGLTRHEVYLYVHTDFEFETGLGGKAVVVSISVAGAYMLLVMSLMYYCRKRRLQRRTRSRKLEIEMAEGRRKLFEKEEEKRVAKKKIGDKESGADNSESCVSKTSKKSGQFDHLALPKSLITEQVVLGRGEFGEVFVGKLDMVQLRKLRNKDSGSSVEHKHVLLKMLTTKDETQLAEFRRQLDMLSRIRHENVARLYGLCNESDPHCMVIEYSDWGDLKQFLIATRTQSEREAYEKLVGTSAAGECGKSGRSVPALRPEHAANIILHLAKACDTLANRRFVHRDIAARNCVISSKLNLKLSYPALTRGPHSHEYFKIHDQVIPLRWSPLEVVTENDYSTKSDVYMFAATVWEIYTKAELPFAKLNDNSVLERLKNNSLEWTVPDSVPAKIATILKKCWSILPTDRPLFSDICEDLTTILKEISSENGTVKHVDL